VITLVQLGSRTGFAPPEHRAPPLRVKVNRMRIATTPDFDNLVSCQPSFVSRTGLTNARGDDASLLMCQALRLVTTPSECSNFRHRTRPLSDDEIATAIHTGVRPDGRSPESVRALIAGVPKLAPGPIT
jgi:hypothetical protein